MAVKPDVRKERCMLAPASGSKEEACTTHLVGGQVLSVAKADEGSRKFFEVTFVKMLPIHTHG